MMPAGPIQLPRETPYEKLRVHETLSSALSSAKRKVGALRSSLSGLPPVKADGSSDCQHAERLYYRKESLARELQVCRSNLQEYLAAIEGEYRKRNSEHGRIVGDAKALKLRETQEQYRNALAAQDARCREVAQQKQTVIQVLAEVDRVLDEAASKQWPLGEPREGAPGGMGVSGMGGGRPTDVGTAGGDLRGVAGDTPPRTTSFGPELDGLLTMSSPDSGTSWQE